MKILVTGNAGSGKSTLAKKLSKELSISLYSLDAIVWSSNWKQTPKEEKEKRIKEILKKDTWVIEGVSKLALQQSDITYFLDIPTYRCILNILLRFLKNPIGSRDELPNNCPEYIGVFKALKISVLFNRKSKIWILDSKTKHKTIIKSYKNLPH